jgi:mRNA-degrading endonuclease RelE of RelBE toxin-antitoxin system
VTWTCRLSTEAAKQFRRLPKGQRRLVAECIDEMGENPLGGDVRPVKSGRFKGTLRKRVGQYRIVFAVDATSRTVDIAAILRRGERTYR